MTALIGPSGCGKSTLLRCLNRMNDELGNVNVGGRILLDGVDIYARDVDPVELRMRVGQVFQKPNPFPMSIYDNVALRAAHARHPQARRARRARRGVAAARGAVGRGQGPPQEARVRALRRPAAAAVHRARARDAARGAADGRARLGARPDLDAADRGHHRRAQDRRSPSSSSRTTCSRPRASPTRPRSCCASRWRRPRSSIEVGETKSMFTNPPDKRTEAYITGRFG